MVDGGAEAAQEAVDEGALLGRCRRRQELDLPAALVAQLSAREDAAVALAGQPTTEPLGPALHGRVTVVDGHSHVVEDGVQRVAHAAAPGSAGRVPDEDASQAVGAPPA